MVTYVCIVRAVLFLRLILARFGAVPRHPCVYRCPWIISETFPTTQVAPKQAYALDKVYGMVVSRMKNGFVVNLFIFAFFSQISW